MKKAKSKRPGKATEPFNLAVEFRDPSFLAEFARLAWMESNVRGGSEAMSWVHISLVADHLALMAARRAEGK